MTAPPIRAVLFDAGNTLLFVDSETVRSIVGDEGVEVDPEAYREAEYRARRNLARAVAEGRGGTESHVWRDYFQSLFRSCGVPEERFAAVAKRLRELHAREGLWTEVAEGAAEALPTLADDGYRLAVVSNSDGQVENLLEKADLRRYFEIVVDSHRVGVEKPNPEIFRHALRHLRLEPDECLYVGDLYPVDVVGARRAGLRAVLLDPLGRMDVPVDRIPSVRELPGYLAALRRQER